MCIALSTAWPVVGTPGVVFGKQAWTSIPDLNFRMPALSLLSVQINSIPTTHQLRPHINFYLNIHVSALSSLSTFELSSPQELSPLFIEGIFKTSVMQRLELFYFSFHRPPITIFLRGKICTPPPSPDLSDQSLSPTFLACFFRGA